MEKTNQRISKLDGLRGLLSLVVTLNHSFLVLAIPAFANVWGQNVLEFHDWQSKIQQIMMILGNGGAAVTLFFILSGFVMGLSLNKFSKIDFLDTINFYIKRIIRLYPVYLFLVVVTAIYMWTIFVYKVYPAASSWYTWWMNFQMTIHEFFLNVFFIHTYLGGVTWTLRVILVASIIFPIFYLINKRTSKPVDLLLVVLLIVLDFTVFIIPDFRDLRYLFMFYSGLIIAKFSKFFHDIPGWIVYLSSPFLIFVLLDVRYLTDEYVGGVVENIICWFIIGVLAYGQEFRLFNFLETKFFKYLGKVSYSIYLTHFSVLYILSKIMFENLPNLPYKDHYLIIHFILWGLSLGITLILSSIIYRFVEKPALVLSSKLQIRPKQP